MAAHRLPNIVIVRRPHKIKPAPRGNDMVNIDSLSSFEPCVPSKQSISPQSGLLRTEEMANDTKETKRPSFSNVASDNLKNISDENSLMPKVGSPNNKIKSPKLLVLLIGIGIIIVLFVLAAFSMGIYALVQMSKTTTTTSTPTTSLGLLWSTVATTVAGTGVAGNQVNEMGAPWHITFDSSGALYVADSSYNRVAKWIINGLTGTIVAGQINGQSGNTTYYLSQPYGVYIDPSNNIYVANTRNHRVQLWASDASSITTVAGTGISGSTSTQLNSPASLTLDLNSSKLYIADTGNHRIMSYALGASVGIMVAGGNEPGTLTIQLYSPSDVYFDSSLNSLFIANSGAHTIVQWVIGASTWSLVAGFNGNSGPTPLMLNYPLGLTFDSMGNLYVADTNNARVQLFRSGNVTGTTIAGVTDTPGNRVNLLNAPRAVALDSRSTQSLCGGFKQ